MSSMAIKSPNWCNCKISVVLIHANKVEMKKTHDFEEAVDAFNSFYKRRMKIK